MTSFLPYPNVPGPGSFDTSFLTDPSGDELEPGNQYLTLHTTPPPAEGLVRLPSAADSVEKGSIRFSQTGTFGEVIPLGVEAQSPDVILADFVAGAPVFPGTPLKTFNFSDLSLVFEAVPFVIPAGFFGPDPQPAWSLFWVGGSYNLSWLNKIPVRAATTGPLPAFTSNGLPNFDEILTANANGNLVVDTIAFGADERSLMNGLLVGNEGDKTKHGLWHVIEPGDGSTPWQLRRRPDFSYSSALTLGGATVSVLEGATNAGKIYTAENPGGGTATPGVTAFDWIVNS